MWRSRMPTRGSSGRTPDRFAARLARTRAILLPLLALAGAARAAEWQAE